MGVRITGCTIHWVNSDLDGGKIIAQAPVRIMEGDNLEIVTARVHAAEHMLLPWVVSDLSHRNHSLSKVKMLKASCKLDCRAVEAMEEVLYETCSINWYVIENRLNGNGFLEGVFENQEECNSQ